MSEANEVKEDKLDKLVRDIFDVTSTPYWKDRAAEVKEMIRDFIAARLSRNREPISFYLQFPQSNL